MTIVYSDFLSALKNSHDYGKYISGVCPFHNDASPSLLVYKDGWFRCLGCNRQGKWASLWNKVKGQAVNIRPDTTTAWMLPEKISDLDMLVAQAHEDLMKFPSFQWYLQMRGLENRIEPAMLGYYRGWYTIPVFNEDSKLITCVFRSLPHVQEATNVRYFCREKPTMYVPDWNRMHRPKQIAVVYGMLDALTLSELRIPVVTTTYGKDTFSASWLDKYRVPVRVIPDAGEEKSALTLSGQLGWRGGVIRLPYPAGVKDPNDYFKTGRKPELLARLMNIFEGAA